MELALAIGITSCVWAILTGLLAFAQVRREERWRQRCGALERESKDRCARLENQYGELRELITLAQPAPPSAVGLNLTGRSQALRMFRQGSSPADIAAALSMPQSEVALLLKVYRTVIANIDPEVRRQQ